MVISLISACDNDGHYRKGENLGMKALNVFLTEKKHIV